MSRLEAIWEKSDFHLAMTRDSIWRTVIALDLSAQLVVRGQFQLHRGLAVVRRPSVYINGIARGFQTVSFEHCRCLNFR